MTDSRQAYDIETDATLRSHITQIREALLTG